ncbi:antitermination protein NusB [Mycoplasmopsis californica HAZ160_1]|uniref:Antitermination protein NusB n=2 Tax=Mycoplasmopsis californica TaxID=2113 RepID=A0A059XVQ5_9BACT|nr:transcription antitermination protein NusB [Mycoplasmopsis californica]AIA29302.1 antitermination protein NusB [Mycoplasmopsis californica]BAP01235.1 antitermination protein NusB [Mycoplasmopsis californica HAZ160_1]BBG41109.1 antitermination protein NusB [Mycoplasmopsis californica]BBG41702.1 antitermination protein NusB [Mycoplasmopsis californica]BBG42296.1 antitermination protein NusB [Mycoplasmopsis californica]
MKSRRTNRIEIVNAIYACELLQNYDLKSIFENNDHLEMEQFKQIQKVVSNVDVFRKVIEKFLEIKTWEQESPLVRAIILNATYELFSIPPKVAINEAVEITKDFFGEESNLYKHVNKVLDRVYKYSVANEALIRTMIK